MNLFIVVVINCIIYKFKYSNVFEIYFLVIIVGFLFFVVIERIERIVNCVR